MAPNLLTAILVLADETPDDNDVVAGPIGFVIFIGLVIAVALLGWSLNKHLKKAHRAADKGVYDEPDEPDEPAEPADPIETSTDQKSAGEQ